MAVMRVDAAAALGRRAEFDALIDARSESEYADDHLPGAVNWPTLHDAERAEVGTQYAQVGAFEARKRGAALAARNIAAHLEHHAAALPRGWRPLVYCWRGGQRSGALATVLDQIGFTVHVLDGGYRAFRREVIAALEALPACFDWRVLAGHTGSGKSRLLRALGAAGAQVLDLEGLAEHRGSVLGQLPGQPQPSQRAFETRLWCALSALDRSRRVFVESESRKVGNLHLPEALMATMRDARCVRIDVPIDARVALLLEDYGHFTRDAGAFCERLAALAALRGAERVAQWSALARAGQWPQVVRALLEQHYDPIYSASTARNYTLAGGAIELRLPDANPASLAEAARLLAADRTR
jgi:tRNA 2-selenouridine synthase